ncbi:MAG: histidine kinase [Nocardioidaceae bacterium]
MHEPTPEQYNPPLTLRAHLWRTAAALAISAAIWPATAVLQWRDARPLFVLDVGVGLLALVLSFYRRRWPLAVAMLTNLAGAVSITASGPAVLASVSLATRRVVWQVVLAGTVGMAGAITFPLFEPSPDDGPWWVTFAVGLAFTIAMLVWGMYVGSRRELLWTLRERAERAEAEQEMRVSQGRSNERARIAREMHDVLAHRISLITMHAGALAYRTDLSAQEMRGTAELIQAKSHEALTDLRQVLGVLRSEDGVTGRERPQPTFGDLAALVLEAQESGMRIRYDDQVLDAATMPDQVGRTTYRIVQEGLTNARKHAPDVTVLVSLSGSARSGVDITIRNPARSLATARIGAPGVAGNGRTAVTPGAGLGLVGLGERAKLAGGRLVTRRDGSVFELHGWLPWTP